MKPLSTSHPTTKLAWIALAAASLATLTNHAAESAGTNAPQPAPPYVLTVTSRPTRGREWIDTGLRVTPKQVIKFQVSGLATHNVAVGYSSADGNARVGLAKVWTNQYGPALLDEAPLGALVGRIGENGSPFLIGQLRTLTATNDGALFLGFNESLGQTNDNDGAFTVRIRTDDPSPVQVRSGPETYAHDVEFLLAELEKRAGRFFPLKGVDWAKVSAQFRQEVKSVRSDAEHVKLCQRLIARLRDGHAGLLDLKVPWPDDSQGRRWTGPCVHLLAQSDRVYVRQAFGSAAGKGVRAGMEVARIDGVPAHEWLTRRVDKARDDQGYSTGHQALYAACHWGLADWTGTSIEFELLQGEERKTVTLNRAGGSNFVPVGPLFPPTNLRRLGRQSYGKTSSGFGYLHLRDTPANLPEQLDLMLEGIGDVPGLILDMRANGGGGCDHTAVFGRFVPAGETWRQYPSAGRRPFAGPMVVIVDPGTRSAGETVSGMFKEDGRAYMIGDGPTAGTSSQKATLTVPSGLFSVRFSVASNKGRFNDGRGIEGIGVPPHEVVTYDVAELRRGVDSQIRRAEDLLRQGLPADKVPYERARNPR